MKVLNSPKKENVLVIGGNGFIGINLIKYFNSHGKENYQFIVLSRNKVFPNIEGIIYETGDYGSSEVLEKLFSKWQFSKIFHLATSTTPVTSNTHIIEDINGNLLATINLLEIMKSNNCAFLLYLSSGGAVYGEKTTGKIKEEQVCTPISSYGIVKLTIENYLRLYQKQYGVNYLTLRVSNPFGEFHTSNKQGIINIAIRKAIKGELIEVWGDGNQSKDYIFVEDLAKIILHLVQKGVTNTTINVGSNNVRSLNEVLLVIKSYLPNLEIKYVPAKKTDVKYFNLDISKLKSIMDINFTDFDTAIKKTILWESLQVKTETLK